VIRPGGRRAEETRERELAVLRQARLLSGATAAGVLALAAATSLVETRPALPVLGSAAALAGLVSPLIGYRLFAWLRERVPPGASHAERCAGFLRATLLSVAAGGSVALFGIVAYWLSAALAALIGVVTLVILVGAVWPTPERLDSFLDAAAPAAGGAP
jgi:hypothetical protein